MGKSMSITSKIDKLRQLALISVVGKMPPNEIVSITESNLSKLQVSNLLFDLRYIDIEDNILFNELENVCRAIKNYNDKHINYVKTAILASTDLWFKVAKKLIPLQENQKQCDEISVFRFKHEAVDWLFAIH